MIAGMTYYQICCYFLIYSFLGWVSEVMYHAVTLGKVVNRGFLNGPVCPVYGFGMLGILALGNVLASGDVADMPAYLMFLFGIAVATVIELIAGWALDVLFHARWWDYSNEPFNFRGYICLKFSLIWGLGIVFIIRILHPVLANAHAFSIPAKYSWPLVLILYLVYLVDLIVTVLIVRNFNREIAELDELQKKLRIVSDRLSEKIGTDTVKAAQHIQEGQVQAALAKAELRDMAEERKAELSAARSRQMEAERQKLEETKQKWAEERRKLEEQKQRLEAQRQKLAARLSGGRLFGAGRLLRAFPTYKNLKHGEIVERLKEQMNKPSKGQ